MKKVDLEKIDVSTIRNLLIRIGSPAIPLTLIFEKLGFEGITGIQWGILAGAVCTIAIELGYRIDRTSRSIILVQKIKSANKRTSARVKASSARAGAAVGLKSKSEE
ncbi:hypothetical protein MUP77_05635 [Candidatus Bathyarchaeota archaeon]|nr:hypothetical protein [Candidatus Bathyarchaeota archaeon]